MKKKRKTTKKEMDVTQYNEEINEKIDFGCNEALFPLLALTLTVPNRATATCCCWLKIGGVSLKSLVLKRFFLKQPFMNSSIQRL